MTKRILQILSVLALSFFLLSGTVQVQNGISYGVLYTPFSATTLTGSAINSSSYTLPSNSSSTITWAVAYGSTPASVSIVLQGSLDNSVFYDIDSTTSTSTDSSVASAGAYRYIRFRIASSSGGSTVTIKFSIKQGAGASNGTGGAGDASEATLQEIKTLLETSAENDVAHGDDDTGFPLKIGGKTTSGLPTPLTTGKRTDAWFNLYGALGSFLTANDAGGCTPNSSISAGAVLETQVKATPGQLYEMVVTNIDATPVFLKLYNDTSANTDETDTPIGRYGVPGTSAVGGIVPIRLDVGQYFSTAITFRVTTGIADNDTGALSANEVLVSYCYK